MRPKAAAQCRTSKLFISANASNKAAQALFAKAGFVQSGSIENLNDGEPELIYFKNLLPGRALAAEVT